MHLALHDFPRVDGRPVDRPLEHFLVADEPMTLYRVMVNSTLLQRHPLLET
jgi:hypothetical protein